MKASDRILVLKFGALGDFVQAFGGFEQIRRAHADAEITLLTTPPFADLARASGLFDVIETDGRPRRFVDEVAMLRRLRRRQYSRIYDLQTSSRSKFYFLAFMPFPPLWSGISIGASHRQTRPDRKRLHNLDRIADQLYVAGIGPSYPPKSAPPPSFAWVNAGESSCNLLEHFGLTCPFVLLVPGASPAKPEKRWPLEYFSILAKELIKRGRSVGIVGSIDDSILYMSIKATSPEVVDLTGKTSLVHLARLGAMADLCVGNDTGPTHLIAYAGAPGAMLMSRVTDPNHCAPRAKMISLHVDELATLSPAAVLEAILATGS